MNEKQVKNNFKNCTVSEYLPDNKMNQKLSLLPQGNLALKSNDNIQY